MARQVALLPLEIPLPLMQLNQVVAAAKRHWAGYARLKRRHTETVALLALAAGCQRVRQPVTLAFVWYLPDRRLDPDNAVAGGVKVIADGLVAAGVLPDDSQAWIRGFHHHFEAPDRTRPRVLVSWEELPCRR